MVQSPPNLVHDIIRCTVPSVRSRRKCSGSWSSNKCLVTTSPSTMGLQFHARCENPMHDIVAEADLTTCRRSEAAREELMHYFSSQAGPLLQWRTQLFVLPTQRWVPATGRRKQSRIWHLKTSRSNEPLRLLHTFICDVANQAEQYKSQLILHSLGQEGCTISRGTFVGSENEPM